MGVVHTNNGPLQHASTGLCLVAHEERVKQHVVVEDGAGGTHRWPPTLAATAQLVPVWMWSPPED